MNSISITTNITMQKDSYSGGGEIARLNKQIEKLTQEMRDVAKKGGRSEVVQREVVAIRQQIIILQTRIQQIQQEQAQKAEKKAEKAQLTAENREPQKSLNKKSSVVDVYI